MDWFVFLKVAYLLKKEHVIGNVKRSLSCFLKKKKGSLKKVAMKYLQFKDYIIYLFAHILLFQKTSGIKYM